MELKQIVDRIAEAIPIIDSTTDIQNNNRRNKRPYIKGVATLWEPQFVTELIKWWKQHYPNELTHIDNEIPYPHNPADTCDIVLTSTDVELPFGEFEWAIEIKYLRLVGNNGNNNDYVGSKAISPYLKDRSLIHDVEKLKGAKFSHNKAVIFYGLEYDSDSIAHAERICGEISNSLGINSYYIEKPINWYSNGFVWGPLKTECESGKRTEEEVGEDTCKIFLTKDMKPIPKNLRKVLRAVDKENMVYNLKPIVEIVTDVMTARKFTTSKPFEAEFDGLERHPCGMKGRVAGWQITI